MYGPMQLLVITFPRPDFPTDLQSHLKSVREQGFVRLLDAVFVSKADNSDLLVLEGSDLQQEELILLGVMASAFFGYGVAGEVGADLAIESSLLGPEKNLFGMEEDDLLEIADRIPVGSSALFLLLEHLWATGLKGALESSEGAVVANGWIAPATLMSMGENAVLEL